MKRLLRLCFTSILLLSLLHGPVTYAQSSVTPTDIEVTLNPGDCTQETVTVTLSESPLSSLDVVLAIDVTGSMELVIYEVTRSAGQIVTDIRNLVPDVNFALMTLADYPEFGGGSTEDYPWRLDQDFTADGDTLQSALNNITLMDGGDNPESYLRALYETQNLHWRAGARRLVILFGDSYPHDPDPGSDETLGTADDITKTALENDLAENDITVLGIYTNEDTKSFYQEMATSTGGYAFQLSNVGRVAQVIQQLVRQTVTQINRLTLEPTAPGDSWLKWEPEAHHDISSPETRTFDLNICVPDGTTGGDYNFDIRVTGDGATLGTIPTLIHVPHTSTSVSTPSVSLPEAPSEPPIPPSLPAIPGLSITLAGFQWWWILIPLALLLLLALLWWLLSRRGKKRPPLAPPRRRPDVPPPSGPPKKPPSHPTGRDVTHGQPPPKRRR